MNMRKLHRMKYLGFLLAFFMALACSKEQSRITGRITESKGKMLYFEHVDAALTKTIDSVKLRNSGRFRFSARLKMPDFYQLRFENKQIISLLVRPSESIKVKANGNQIAGSMELTGSFESENLNKLIRYLNETRVNLDSVGRLYASATADTMRERLYKEYTGILESHRKYSMGYLLTHTNSLTCIYVLYQELSPGNYVFYKTKDLQFFKIVSDTLGKYYPRSKHVIAFRKNANRLLSNYQSKVLMEMADTVQTDLPVVELKDMYGTVRKLSSLKGKYVLLTFWASWNEDCVEQNLLLKEVYKKYYRQNFEILQVSFDNSPEEWKRAIRFDELPWLSVIDPTFPGSAVAVSYNVQSLPANYLIDKDNASILARDISPDQLLVKLSELLN
jgi:thiol-disulfide isomerase/thioredoxin